MALEKWLALTDDNKNSNAYFILVLLGSICFIVKSLLDLGYLYFGSKVDKYDVDSSIVKMLEIDIPRFDFKEYCIKYISDCLKEDNGDNCKTIAFKFWRNAYWCFEYHNGLWASVRALYVLIMVFGLIVQIKPIKFLLIRLGN